MVSKQEQQELEQILNETISSDQQYTHNVNDIVEIIKQSKDEKISKILLDFINTVLKSKDPCLKKFLSLKLLKDCIDSKNIMLPSLLAKSKLLNTLKQYAKFEAKNQNEDRGKNLFHDDEDGSVGIYFLNLLLESIVHWAKVYSKKDKVTPFQTLLLELQSQKIKFPSQNIFYPNVATSKTQNNQQQKGFPQQEQLQYKQQVLKNNVQIVQEVLENNSDIDSQCLEILQGFQKEFQDIKNLYENCLGEIYQNYMHLFSEKERDQLVIELDFLNTYLNKLQRLKQSNCSQSSQQSFKKHIIRAISKIKNEKTDQIKGSESNIDQNKVYKLNIDQNNETKDIESKAQNETEKQEIANNTQQQIQRDVQEFGTFMPQAEFQISNPQQQQQYEFNNFENFNNQDFASPTIANDKKHFDDFGDFGNAQEQQKFEKQENQFQQNDSNLEKQQQIDFENFTNFNTNDLQIQKKQEEVEPQPIQNTVDFFKGFEKQEIAQSSIQNQNNIFQMPTEAQEDKKIDHEQLKKTGEFQLSQKQQQFNNKIVNSQVFSQDFSQLSVSNLSIKGFPQNQLYKERQRNLGQVVQYNPNFFIIQDLKQYDYKNLRRFKSACLKNKCPLYEFENWLQIGTTTNIFFDMLTSMNFCKISIYVGNKGGGNVENLQLKFHGNESCQMWVRPDAIKPTLFHNSQNKQDVVVIYKKIPFQLITLSLSGFDMKNEKAISLVLNLPLVIIKFMEFKNIDAYVFKHQWKNKKLTRYCSQQIQLNPNLMRNPSYVKRYFPKLIELTDLKQFSLQGKDGYEYSEYKLGGVFELNLPGIQFLLKVLVLPNSCVIFQVASPSTTFSYIAEYVIQTLVFLFQK